MSSERPRLGSELTCCQGPQWKCVSVFKDKHLKGDTGRPLPIDVSSCVASVYVRGPGLAGPGRPLAWGHMDGHGGVTDRSVEGGEDERG